MRVLVIGANGKIGRHLIKILAQESDHTPKALIRKEEQKPYFDELGVETIVASLEGSVEDLATAMEGSDAVVFTAGSGGNTGPDKTLLIDLDGAAKAIEAAGKLNTGRFIMVSAIFADRREYWSESMAPYYVAKHHADNILRASGLNYTIVRPGGLLDEPGTGKVAIAHNLEAGSVPREDVARVLYHSLDNEKTYNKSFDLNSGKDDIKNALGSL
ncbi:SDR family oxidoreductase [Planococcus lenghuensis]|uniref:Sugar epimerase n=1 Tax=Planococcus lenghuensis TaxID=2213202 RepID=A0A1Q2L0G4_9BACL|nr:SDR family oxidoreductase [Planococcus lenghuensis]AQQ53547.1 sugar epimerase [Planococcus lenghuensis]